MGADQCGHQPMGRFDADLGDCRRGHRRRIAAGYFAGAGKAFGHASHSRGVRDLYRVLAWCAADHGVVYVIGDAAVVSFFKQKTAYAILRRDWSSDVCSSDLAIPTVAITKVSIKPPHWLVATLVSPQ